jgi:uncharacterized hydrophobic protein (TIGR00271 family)
VVHLRIVAPHAESRLALERLRAQEAVTHIVFLEDVAQHPRGDLILADVPREAASLIIAELKALGIHECGAISIEPIETQLSRLGEEAERLAPGEPSDAVIWEEVEGRTSEQTRLTTTFGLFMVLAALLAAVGIFLDSAILVVGAMVVGPEFGPIAAFCVALVEGRRRLAGEAFAALAVGFTLAITSVWLATHAFRLTGVTPDVFTEADHDLSNIISNPDFFSYFTAFCAGAAGMLSLSTAKSGALIGVLISVTTIPAAANIGVAAAYGDWSAWRGSMLQLAINVAMILVAGVLTLGVQRWAFFSRLSASRGGRTTRRSSSAPASRRRP